MLPRVLETLVCSKPIRAVNNNVYLPPHIDFNQPALDRGPQQKTRHVQLPVDGINIKVKRRIVKNCLI